VANYRRTIEHGNRKKAHEAVRNTIFFDGDDEQPGNEWLVWTFEELKDQVVPRNKIVREAHTGEITLVFHPARLGQPVQSYTFPRGVVVTRRTKKPPTFTVVGRTLDGRELWLTVGLKDQRYVVTCKHFSGELPTGASTDVMPESSRKGNGSRTRRRHPGHE